MSGLSLRSHAVSLLRAELQARRITTCAEPMASRDGRWLDAAGMVLVRQRPGSAKGALFLPLEDKTGIASFVVWPKVFEQHRRIILSTSMMAVRGRIQREGEVVHLVARRVTDLSALLAGLDRGDEAQPGNLPSPRAGPGLAVPTHDFR